MDLKNNINIQLKGVRMAKVTKCLWMVEQIGKWDF